MLMSTFGTARLTALVDVVEAASGCESGAIMTSATAIAAAAITASLELRFIENPPGSFSEDQLKRQVLTDS